MENQNTPGENKCEVQPAEVSDTMHADECAKETLQEQITNDAVTTKSVDVPTKKSKKKFLLQSSKAVFPKRKFQNEWVLVNKLFRVM